MKKWSKFVLATMLSAGTMLVSGCIENIEPEGIADLRGAKAELVRAQTALEAAQAAKVEAEAALLLAEAKIKEAIAAQELAKVKYEEALALKAQYEAEYQKLVNEAYAQAEADAHALRVAELEKLIADNEAALAAAALEAEAAAARLAAELLEIQTRVVNAQIAYEKALKDLAVAKVDLTPAQKAYIAPYELAVMVAEGNVDALTLALEQAAKDLATAVATLDEQKADKFALRLAEKNVTAAEAALAGALEAVEIAEAALELDPKVTDWAAERADLEAQLDAMRKEKAEAVLEAEAEAAEYQAAMDALAEGKTVYQTATGYVFNEATGDFSILPDPYTKTKRFDVPEYYVAAPVGQDGNPLFADFHIGQGDGANGSGNYFYYGESSWVIENLFEPVIFDLKAYNNVALEKEIALREKTLADFMESDQYVIPMTKYEDAVAAYEAEDYLPYFEKYEYDEGAVFADAVAEYNTALKAWNEAYAKIVAERAKYAPKDEDYAAAHDALIAEEVAAKAKADAVYYPAIQAADDVLRTAKIAYDRAELVWNLADAKEDAAIDAVETETGVDTVQVRVVVDNYNLYIKAGNKLTPAETEQYNAFVAALKVITDARAEFKAAEETWTKAGEAWTKANEAWTKATGDANKTWTDAYAAAETKRANAVADLNAQYQVNAYGEMYSSINPEYDAYLFKLAHDAFEALVDAEANVDDYMIPWKGYGDREYRLDESLEGYCDGIFYVIGGLYVHYALAEVDEAGKVALAELDVKNLGDAEYFYNNYVGPQLKSLTTDTQINYYFGYNFGSGAYGYDDYFTTSTYMPADATELPTYEDYLATRNDWALNARTLAYEFEAQQESYWYVTDVTIYNVYRYQGVLTAVYEYQSQIDALKAKMDDVKLVPAFLAAIEAKQAEFEAYAAEVEDEIDALRDVIVEAWAELEEQFAAYAEVEAAYNAEIAQIKRVITYLNDMIAMYIDTQDVDALVANLEQTYAAAVEAADQAEFDLEIANDLLERTKAGDVKAVELAQAAYDEAEDKLATAIEELKAAADELAAALERIGEGVAVEEETPATPAA